MDTVAFSSATFQRMRTHIGLSLESTCQSLRSIGKRIGSGWLSIPILLGLGAMILLPLMEAALRRTLDLHPLNSAPWVQHLTLWVGLMGAVLASVERRHFTIALKEVVRSRRGRGLLDILSRAGTVGVLVCLVWASVELVWGLRGLSSEIGDFFPVSLALAPLPAALAAMALITLVRPGQRWPTGVAILAAACLAGPLIPFLPPVGGSTLPILGIAGLVILALVGVPLFVVLGGASLLLFFAAGEPTASVADATYQIVTRPTLPSIPLFALAGVVLARGGAPRRLLRLITAWIGWMRGGASVATILGCAFFTAITGASGVTILALGALLFPILLAAHHEEKFNLGLLTASGSVGLLFPPSVPVILCAVYGGVGLDFLFVAAFLPGVLLLLILGAFALLRGGRSGGVRPAFDLREALAATSGAWGDLLLPVLVVAAFFGGILTPVETAALAALWAVVLETLIHRSLGFRNDLPEAMRETGLLVGALIIVIGFAQSLFSYLVDAQVPLLASAWIESVIGSKWVFLLVLNLALLLVGAFMDIYSALVVVVPLLLPMAGLYGIHPAHLGVIFLTNMELGYLTPPVGLNLFLSSATFGKPILEVWKAVIPFLFILAVWVLLVTYLPWLSVGVAEWVLG